MYVTHVLKIMLKQKNRNAEAKYFLWVINILIESMRSSDLAAKLVKNEGENKLC
jgi:hypothetical protein